MFEETFTVIANLSANLLLYYHSISMTRISVNENSLEKTREMQMMKSRTLQKHNQEEKRK
jgi:hypothetical protein